MARVATDFRDMLLAMLPQGSAWPTEVDSNWGNLLLAFGDEFAIFDSRCEQLLAEMDTRSVSELLPEWENDYGLPGACITTAQSLNDRRRALVVKAKFHGRQDKQMFIDAAAELGYTITITEYDAAHPGPQPDYNGIPLVGDAWNFVWQINASDTTSRVRRYGDEYPGPYTDFGNELLECSMRSLAHAHRVLFFAYS